jgi:hypothetical protein
LSPVPRIRQHDEAAEMFPWLVASAATTTKLVVELDFGRHSNKM